MKKYPKIFKEIRLKKFKTNVMKKRIHTLETLTDHELIDKIDENDIYLETYDIIPIKAEKIFRKNEERRRKEFLLKKQKQKNEEISTNTTYFHINHKNPVVIRNETPDFFVQKYKELLENQKLKSNQKNIKKFLSVSTTVKNDNLRYNNSKTINKSLNKSSMESEKEFYEKYMKNKKKSKKFFSRPESELLYNKNKTQSSTLSYQISTLKSEDNDKEALIILKTKNEEYLEQPRELRQKEKLVKLNEDIYDYENSEYYEPKIRFNDKQISFSNEFLRPSFIQSNNLFIEKKPIIGLKSNIKEYYKNYVDNFKPKNYKKNFKNFGEIFTKTIKNDLNRELFMEKKSDMIDINKIEPNPNKWIDDLDSNLNKIVVKYYKSLDSFIYYGKQGAYTSHYNKIRKGDKAFKEGIRLSQRENI